MSNSIADVGAEIIQRLEGIGFIIPESDYDCALISLQQIHLVKAGEEEIVISHDTEDADGTVSIKRTGYGVEIIVEKNGKSFQPLILDLHKAPRIFVDDGRANLEMKVAYTLKEM